MGIHVPSLNLESFRVKNSPFGSFDTESLKTVINLAVLVQLGKINEELSKRPMQLPDTGYFNITNAELELEDGYMAVRGDIDLD